MIKYNMEYEIYKHLTMCDTQPIDKCKYLHEIRTYQKYGFKVKVTIWNTTVTSLQQYLQYQNNSKLTSLHSVLYISALSANKSCL